MKYAILTLVFILPFGLAATSQADTSDLRGETFCFPAKDVPKLVEKLSEVKEKRRNIVDVRLDPKFIIKDGGVWPDEFYLAKDGELVTNLPFSRDTGEVPNFIAAASAHPDTDICVDDPTRADRPSDDEGLYFEMGLSPLFKTATGEHQLAELEEAAKDGKSFYKKMVPGVIALVMPDTDYFAVKMKDRSAVPTVFARTASGQAPIDLEKVGDMWCFSLDDVEDAEAASVVITGGAYDLQPVPSPKTLRKFVIGDAVKED